MAERARRMVTRLESTTQGLKDEPAATNESHVMAVLAATTSPIRTARFLPEHDGGFAGTESLAEVDETPQEPTDPDESESGGVQNSSEEDSEDENHNVGYPEYVVVANDQPMHIWDYLGREMSERIMAIQNTSPLPQPDYLQTELHEPQPTGITKLINIINGFLDGGIQGDEMGLGKTLQAIVTTIENRPNVKGCFDLIVTTKATIAQWEEELQQHFKPEFRPRVLVLKDPKVTANELLDGGWDFVIVSYNFLSKRWQVLRKYRDFCHLVEFQGVEYAMTEVSAHERPNLHKRPNASLLSPVFRILNQPIRHLILDEVQFLKKSSGVTHEAVKQLYASRTMLLSGTFIPDKWSDLFGVLQFFPRAHPFNTLKAFRKAFGTKDGDDRIGNPTISKRNRLIKFLQAITVSRPASILQLPDLKETTVRFELLEDQELQVAFWAMKFARSLKMSDSEADTSDILSSDKKRAALAHAIRSQQYCASYSTVPQYVRSKEKDASEQGATFLQKFLDTYKASDSKDGEATSCASPSRADLARDYAIYLGSLSNLQILSQTWRQKLAAEHRLDDDETSTPGAAKSKGDNSDEEDISEDDDANGESLPNEARLLSKKEQADEKVETVEAAKEGLFTPTRISKSEHAHWIQQLKEAPDSDIFSPKIKANLNLITTIYNSDPGETIVVFSTFLQYLDVLAEAMNRDPYFKDRGIRPLRFDGTRSEDERSSVRQQFASSTNTSNPLLITATAGGAGINLQSASQVIICEPWWCENLTRQAIGRVYRRGQKKQVSAYYLFGDNSVIDYIISGTAHRKATEVEKIMSQIRRLDEDKPVIPKQYKYGVGE